MKKKSPCNLKNIWVVLLAITVLANACTCNNSESKDPDQPTDTSAALEQKEAQLDTVELSRKTSPEHFDTATQEWVLKTLKKKEFQPADFQAHSNITPAENAPTDTAENIESLPTGSLGPTAHFEMPKDFAKHYAPLLRWSKDSNYIVDLGSYGRVTNEDKEGNVTLEAGEPDTRVMLINLIKHEQTQILFGGPGLQVMDAKWVNDSVFGLIYANTVHTKPDTLLMLTNTHSLEANTYNYNEKQ